MTRTIAAEWLRLRTVRSTWWFAWGGLSMMVAVAMLTADGTAAELRADGAELGSVDAATAAITSIGWVHFVFGGLGMVAMTSEYATRHIVVTLACTPSRVRLLVAKATVVGLAVFGGGIVVAAVGLTGSVPLLRGYGHFDLAQAGVRVLAMAAHLASIAVLALGLGALIRRSAGTITVLFVLLLVVPNLLHGLAGPLGWEFLATAAEYTPAQAGNRFMAGEAVFGVVLAGWAVAALAAGGWALRVRDA